MADRNGYIGRAPGDSSVVVARQVFSPTGVTTDFTFASGYTVGYLDAYLNGVRLIEGQDYSATDTSTVGLTSFAQNGDVLELVAYKAFNVATIDTAPGNLTVGNDLTVGGDVRISGILTVGSSSVTVDGNNNEVLVGSGITLSGNTGIVSATSFYGDGSNLSNIISGVGIQSSSSTIGTGITTINFIGSGITVSSVGTTANVTIDIPSSDSYLSITTRVGIVTVTAYAGILTVFGRISDTNILV